MIIGTIFGKIFTPQGAPGGPPHHKGKMSIFENGKQNPSQIGQFWAIFKK